MSTLLQDIRYAVRMLAKSSGFACAALLILALGIGGVTAMFNTLYTVMIQPLPYSRPGRLVLGRATFSGTIGPTVAGPDYVDYRDKSRSFSSLEAFFPGPFEVTVVAGGRAERARSQIASTGLLPALGVNMALGRPFAADEGRDGAPPVAIISHAYWRKHFAAQTDLTGRSLVIDGASYDLVGVTPPGFHFIQDADVWLPLRPQMLGPRRYKNWLILGRLRDGVTLAEAQSDVDVIAAQLEKAYPDTNANVALLLTPLQGALTEQYRSSFGLLFGGAAAILLIAWANAAGLLLARGAGRQGELAVRAVMGASRWRLIRLLLTEALVLAGAAAVAGTILAVWMQNGLLRLMPIEALLLRDVGLSLPVLLFVLATTVLTGLAFGLLPAWRARHVALAQDLRSSGRGALQQGVRLRSGLVAGQVTVSFVLLVVAGLLTRSFTSLHQTDPGFNCRNLLTAEVPLLGYPDANRAAFLGSLLESVRSLPGVVSAAAISQLPLRNPFNNVGIYAADAPPANPMEGGDGFERVVLPGYFETMGIPLLSGRDIQPNDTRDSRRVVIISRQLAATLFPKRDPLGRQVVIDGRSDVTWEVMGIVSDVKQDDLRQEARARGTFYRAYGQQTPPTMRLAVRTSGNPLAVVASLRALLQKMDRGVPLSGPRTMEAVMANSTVSEKAQTLYLTTFSLLAVTLAAVGLYGLLAYVVAQRQREIGIRVALGAQASDVARPIVVEALVLAGAGLAIGIPAALVLAHLIRTQLYGVTPSDPLTFAGGSSLLLGVTLLAAYLPARRAAKVDPMVALRCE
jgi:putative ABC transport system permease protein